jgi:hypothetical protein
MQCVTCWISLQTGWINKIAIDEDGKPDVPTDTSTCWQLFGWRAGCTWNREEKSKLEGTDWEIEHEHYDVFGDYDADVKVHGYGCEGTTLKCVGSHSSYVLPSKCDFFPL